MFTKMKTGEAPPIGSMMLLYLIIPIIQFGYEVFFLGSKGATPGKKIMKLRVALPDGHYPIGYGKAALRVLGRMISGICLIGYIMIFFDKLQNRALHDRIAGTVVIQV